MKLRQAEIDLLKELLVETQKLDTVMEHLRDKNRESQLYTCLTKQSKRYHEMMDQIRLILLKGSIIPQQKNAIAIGCKRLEIDAMTLLDCSSENIAATAILQKTKKLSTMWRAMHHYQNVRSFAVEIAEEMVNFEKETILELQEFL